MMNPKLITFDWTLKMSGSDGGHIYDRFTSEIVGEWDPPSYYLLAEIVQNPISEKLWNSLSRTLKLEIINATTFKDYKLENPRKAE
jgi:hypothetical protein